MTTINFGTTVSLDEAATLIRINPTKHYFLRGEPGIGKSSIMDAFERHYGDAYNYVYFDCANKDLGDIAMPSIDRDKKITEYFLNGIFQHYNGKPMVIMLDEFTKAPQPIQNMLHPLLERRNPRLADWLAPEGTVTFLTGNMASDGVGDNIKAHTLNRVTTLTVRKPSADEWLAWAVNHDIDPVVMAWVNQFPHALSSYLEGDQESNPYIFNPKKMQGACVSPRSLQLASDSIKNREHVTANAMLADMIGTIGESGARDMHAFVEYQDQLPTWEAITTNPSKAKLPDSPGACAVMVFSAVAKVDRATITPVMEYIERMEAEWQAVFAINIAKNPNKNQIAFTSTKFRDWTLKNVDVL
jgi:hypothetical protein